MEEDCLIFGSIFIKYRPGDTISTVAFKKIFYFSDKLLNPDTYSLE